MPAETGLDYGYKLDLEEILPAERPIILTLMPRDVLESNSIEPPDTFEVLMGHFLSAKHRVCDGNRLIADLQHRYAMVEQKGISYHHQRYVLPAKLTDGIKMP